jgi:endoglucanase
MLFTEWAAQSPENSDGSIDFASLEFYVDWMNRHSISWAAWSYSDEEQPYGWFRPGSMDDDSVTDLELRNWGRLVRDLLDDGELNQSFSWERTSVSLPHRKS